MTDLRVAAQQALEALEWHYRQGHSNTLGGLRLKIDEKTLRNLKAALAEPVQEPMKLRPLAPLTGYYDVGGKRVWLEKDEPFPQPTPPQPAEPVQQGCDHCNHPLYAAVKCKVCGRVTEPVQETEMRRCPSCWEPMFPPQPTPLTVERLRDALVASRIVPPAAVEDPDEYDDGVTLHRIEALHRRLA